MSSTFMKDLKKGLLSAAGSGAAMGGKALAKCLAEKMGWQSSKQKKEEEYKKWMASVSTSLDVLDMKVDEISNDLNKGFGDAKIDSYFQAYSRQYDDSVSYRITIKDCYDNLSKLMKRDFADGTDLGKAIENFRNFVVTNKLLHAAHVLASMWGADQSKTTKNILESWTDTCILSAGTNPNSLADDYSYLEFNYQMGVTYLYKAYAVLTTLNNYDITKDLDARDTKTAEWLDSEVKKQFKPITDSFICCTERLILNTYHPELHPLDISFANSAVVKNIGARSQLIAFLVINMDETINNPGIIIKEYLRPSMPVGGKSKIHLSASVNGKSTTEDIDGEKWLPDTKYLKMLMPNWYKVIDKDKNGNLIAFEDSDIITMNYRKKYDPAISPVSVTSSYSEVVGNETFKVEAQCIYQYYNPLNLELLGAKTGDAVCMAYVVLTSHLTEFTREAYYNMNYPDASPGYQFGGDEKTLKENGKNVYISGPSSFDPASIIQIKCRFDPDLISTNHTASFQARFPVSYAPKTISGGNVQPLPGNLKDSIKLIFVNDMALNILVGNYNGSGSMRQADVEIDIYANQNGKKAGYYTHFFESNTNFSQSIDFSKENKYYPSEAAHISQGQLGIPVVPGQKTELTYNVTIKIKGLRMGWNNEYNNILGQIITRSRLAWPQPVPEFK